MIQTVANVAANFGKISGLLKVTIVDPNTYANASYIVVSGATITEINKGWYIASWSVNENEELVITTASAQKLFVTKIM